MVVHTGAVGWYREQVLPRIANVLLGVREFVPLRGRVASGLEGDVLEIGFGSGLNVPHYPSTVRRVWAVDPATVGRSWPPTGLRRVLCPSSSSGSTARTCRWKTPASITC
jgi:hypothetical protein